MRNGQTRNRENGCQAAPCPPEVGCYKQRRNGVWVCVRCGN